MPVFQRNGSQDVVLKLKKKKVVMASIVFQVISTTFHTLQLVSPALSSHSA